MNTTIGHYFKGLRGWVTIYRDCPFGWWYGTPLACNESIRLWVFDDR